MVTGDVESWVQIYCENSQGIVGVWHYLKILENFRIFLWSIDDISKVNDTRFLFYFFKV